MDEQTKSPPDGFQELSPVGSFTDLVGPYYWCAGDSGDVVLGFRPDERHLNLAGIVHGGAYMGFIDVVLGRQVLQACGIESRPVTVSLNSNFLGATRAGEWVTGYGRIMRRTRTMVFLAGELFVDDRLVFTATGIWKLLNPAAQTTR